MDDLIYFLFIIAWLAFSFYQQSAKKKKRQEQMKAAQEREREREAQQEFSGTETAAESEAREVRPVAEQKPKPEQDFRKTLEEILLGEEFKDEEIEQPAQTYGQEANQEPTKSTGTTKKNVYQKYYDEEMLEGSMEDLDDEEPEKMEDKIEQLEEEMVLHEEETIEDPASKPDFDLRKAIIYSEIINRRYN